MQLLLYVSWIRHRTVLGGRTERILPEHTMGINPRIPNGPAVHSNCKRDENNSCSQLKHGPALVLTPHLHQYEGKNPRTHQLAAVLFPDQMVWPISKRYPITGCVRTTGRSYGRAESYLADGHGQGYCLQWRINSSVQINRPPTGVWWLSWDRSMPQRGSLFVALLRRCVWRRWRRRWRIHKHAHRSFHLANGIYAPLFPPPFPTRSQHVSAQI